MFIKNLAQVAHNAIFSFFLKYLLAQRFFFLKKSSESRIETKVPFIFFIALILLNPRPKFFFEKIILFFYL